MKLWMTYWKTGNELRDEAGCFAPLFCLSAVKRRQPKTKQCFGIFEATPNQDRGICFCVSHNHRLRATNGFSWRWGKGLSSLSFRGGAGAHKHTPIIISATGRHSKWIPFSQTGHRKYQKAFPVEWSINRISKSQSKAFEISCKSFIVKLLRLNLLWMFCGLVFILLASSVSVILPRFTNIILMYSVISIVITSPLSYT